MTTKKTYRSMIVPEYVADNLGAPFKVVLVNSVTQVVDDETGEVEKVIVPNVRGLIKCIAMTRIFEPRKLSGEEIKFIRKAFKFSAKHIAELIDVSPEHLSRCEAGDRTLSVGNEKCFRASMFLDQIKRLEGLNGINEADDTVKENMGKLIDALRKVTLIITERKIAPAFHAEPLEMKFFVTSICGNDVGKDDPNADWSSKDQTQALAA
jgi:transcriptional regulator with XRE-family HTH domain